MIAKLAIRNIKKSIKDYGIYFLTLTLTIAIFYIFNSFGDLSIMKNFSSYKKEIVYMVTMLITIVSVFIAIVFSFVIIYANNFIIKKRNKEFATYLLLGMPKNKVSKMLFTETLIVGVLSLIVGLLLGVLFSQVFCFLVAKIFTIPLSFVGFSFSMNSLIYTTVLFAGMFLVVGIFGSITIAKSKLINLMNSNRINEKVAKSIGIKGIIFFLGSLALLFYGYYLVMNNGLVMLNGEFWLMCFCGGAGTVGIYLFLSQVFMYLIPKFKKMYYKKANMFVVKQIGNKINSNGVLLGIISLMIFLSICTLSAGLGMNDYSNAQIDIFMPYDAIITTGNDKSENINADFKKYEKALTDSGAVIENSLVYDANILKKLDTSFNKDIDENISGTNTAIMKLSEYNKIQKFLKIEEPVALKKGEYIFLKTYKEKAGQQKITKVKDVEIGESIFKPADENVKEIENVSNTTIFGLSKYIMIIDDEDINKIPDSEYQNGYRNYLVNVKGEITEEQSEMFSKIVDVDKGNNENNIAIHNVETRIALQIANMGMGISLVFIGVYLSVIFVISSTALLAIQQLSDASEHKYRFNILEKLGASNNLINTSILKQILVYFVAPVVMAIISSIVGVMALEKTMTSFGENISLLVPYLITVGILAAIYIIYFLATFYGYRSIVKVKEREL